MKQDADGQEKGGGQKRVEKVPGTKISLWSSCQIRVQAVLFGPSTVLLTTAVGKGCCLHPLVL